MLSRYPFEHDAVDESRVRSEWAAFGMGQVLERLLTMARKWSLEAGWHWGYVMGPGFCCCRFTNRRSVSTVKSGISA